MSFGGRIGNPFAITQKTAALEVDALSEALIAQPQDPYARENSKDYLKAIQDCLDWIEDYEKAILKTIPDAKEKKPKVPVLGVFFASIFELMVDKSEDYCRAIKDVVKWQATHGTTDVADKIKPFLQSKLKK